MEVEKRPLARDGGTPVSTEVWPAWLGPALIGDAEIEAVTEVLKSKKLFRFLEPETAYCRRLEESFMAMTGKQYALAVGGGTNALIAGLAGLGIGDGDEVIIPAYTYVATAAAVILCGAVPVIAEIDQSLTLDPSKLEACITSRTKAIIPVHMRGYPCDMDAIMAFADQHDLLVLEDTAQACGGSYKDKRLGSFGEVGCFSLQQYKIITAGEGGMVVTDDEAVFQRAALRHDSAMCYWTGDTEGVEPFAGGNFRLNEMEGALGYVQFGRLEGILQSCRRLRNRVRKGIADLPQLQQQKMNDPDGDCGISLTFFLPDGEKAKSFAEALQAEGIPCGSLYDKGIPDRHVYCHWEYVMNKTSADKQGRPWTSPLHDQTRQYSPDMCPQSLDILGRAVILSFYCEMEDRHADMMIEGIRKVAAHF